MTGGLNVQYFEGLNEENLIKSRYKELAKEHHPDLGGDTEAMKQVNAQYKEVLRGAYQKAGKSISEIDELFAKDLQAMEALQLVIGIEGVTVELCGRWVWVSGDTKVVREKLKIAKFRYAPKKKAWYWRPPDEKSRWNKKGAFSMNQIRDKYGSEDLKKKRMQVA